MIAPHVTLRAMMALAPAAILLAGIAQAQQTEVKLEGRCERLVIGEQDLSQSCKPVLINSVAGRRTSFDFAVEDGQTLSFSGTGMPQEGTEVTDPLQPISLVTSSRKDEEAIVRNPAPAVGACRFTTPEPGKSMISCEAKAQGKVYAGTFVTDAKPSAPKP